MNIATRKYCFLIYHTLLGHYKHEYDGLDTTSFVTFIYIYIYNRHVTCFFLSILITLTHCGLVDLRKWTIFNTILTSPKSWLSQEDLNAGCEHSLVPMDF